MKFSLRRRRGRSSAFNGLPMFGTIVRINHNGREQYAVVVNLELPSGEARAEDLAGWLARKSIIRTGSGQGDYYLVSDLLEMEGWLDPESVARARDHFENEFLAALDRVLSRKTGRRTIDYILEDVREELRGLDEPRRTY